MARSIAADLKSVFTRLQTRQSAEMENLLAARSPQQLISLRAFLGAGGPVQRSIHTEVLVRGARGQQPLQLGTLAAHQPSPDTPIQVQPRRSVTTSPGSKEQMLMYSNSIAASSPPHIVAKTLDLLRSRDHLHLGDASAVHMELMRTLELAQDFYRQTRGSTAGSATHSEQLTAGLHVHESQQDRDCPEWPTEYEGMAADLPQQAVEAGVMLDATSEARRQSLFDMALDGTDLNETDFSPYR